MQNNGRNVDDDYALAMQLQKQFDDEYRTNNNNGKLNIHICNHFLLYYIVICI